MSPLEQSRQDIWAILALLVGPWVPVLLVAFIWLLVVLAQGLWVPAKLDGHILLQEQSVPGE